MAQAGHSVMDNMQLESNRIISFKEYPDGDITKIPSPLQMARAGFYYIGKGKSRDVKCFSCHLFVDKWDTDKGPLEYHKEQSPHCMFFQSRNQDIEDPQVNVPIGKESQCYEQALLDTGIGTGSISSNIPKRREPGDLTEDFFEKMKNETERIKTFKNFPEDCWIRTELFTETGLFYVGPGCATQCAFCRRVIKEWGPGDVPKLRHKRESAKCGFVLGHNVGNVPLEMANESGLGSLTPTNSPVHAANQKCSSLESKQQRNPTLENFWVQVVDEQEYRRKPFKEVDSVVDLPPGNAALQGIHGNLQDMSQARLVNFMQILCEEGKGSDVRLVGRALKQYLNTYGHYPRIGTQYEANRLSAERNGSVAGAPPALQISGPSKEQLPSSGSPLCPSKRRPADEEILYQRPTHENHHGNVSEATRRRYRIRDAIVKQLQNREPSTVLTNASASYVRFTGQGQQESFMDVWLGMWDQLIQDFLRFVDNLLEP